MSTTLNSPGVQVTVTDQSQFTAAPAGTVPFILVATAQDKLNQSNAVAQYTTANTAGQVILETSQRSLISDFGAPIFQNVNGTPVNGSELNEYGLLTAYSALGVSDAAYIMRAPIDLDSLAGSLTAPTGTVANGTNWFNTGSTNWGFFQFNAATKTFSPISTTSASGAGKLWVLTSSTETVVNSPYQTLQPINTIGKPGDYAIIPVASNVPLWYMNSTGTWVLVGSGPWQSSYPAVTGNVTVSGVVTGNLIINGSNVGPLTNATLSQVVTAVNSAGIAGIGAISTSNRFGITANSNALNGAVFIGAGSDANVVAGLGLLGDTSVTYYAPAYRASTFTNVPQWNSTDSHPAPTGSIWLNTSIQQNGANIVVETYNATAGTWALDTVTVAANDAAANFILDPIGGGINIVSGALYYATGLTQYAEGQLFSRASGATVITGSNTAPAFASNPQTIHINTSQIGSSSFVGSTAITFSGPSAANLVAAINSSGLPGISAGFNTLGQIYIENSFGGSFYLFDDVTYNPLNLAGFNLPSNGLVTNWSAAGVYVSATAPTSDPTAGTLWYYDDPTQFDILINTGSAWASYRTVTADARGYNLTNTDPAGPIVSASVPSTQSTGSALAYGDIWVDSGTFNENVLSIYRYSSGNVWTLINNTDHVSSNGIVFADARWSSYGNVDPGSGTITPISTLLTITPAVLDSDAPSYALYPRGTLLFNTRRSSYNVKKFAVNYLTAGAGQNGTTDTYTSTWVSASGNDVTGVAFIGSASQRNCVVQSLISAINNSSQLLDEFYKFNLISCPGYPELLPTLVQLNKNRNETAFIVSDSPLTLAANSSTLNTWANNLNGATTDGINGLVTAYDYAATYYPAGLSADLSGNSIVIPAAHMALPTILQNDAVSFPWFAPAGARRGLVSTATSIGYIDAPSGNFVTNSISQSLRDVLYQARVNPISNFSNTGIEIFGQKTRSGQTTELSRVNVARLVIYIRAALAQIGNNFLFEQNDSITRRNLAYAIGEFLKSIQSNRGISDYAVDCSLDNNPPAVIDANELYADVAIAPITSAEFIYIPVTVVGQGVLSGSSVTTS